MPLLAYVNSGPAGIQPPPVPILLGPAKWIWTWEIFSSKEGREHRRLVWFWSQQESRRNVPQWGLVQQYSLHPFFHCSMLLCPIGNWEHIKFSLLPDHSGLCFPSLWRRTPQVRGRPICAPGVNGGTVPAAAEVWCGAEGVTRRSGDGDGRHHPHKERAVVQTEA